MDIGDFAVSEFALEFAREKQAARESRARGVDEEKRGPVTTDASVWAKNPRRLDFPGIDTPSESPRVRPEDLMHPAKTDLSAKAKGESKRGDLPSPERNTDAPVTETARLADQDISLAPEEAFEGVGATEPEPRSSGRGLASGVQADMAFIESEEKRRRK